jgi:surfeit locus 1 family protein
VKPRSLLVVVVVVAVAAVCVRLGFWQLDRLGQKRALNARVREALALPPVPYDGGHPAALAGRRVVVRGTYDEGHQLLLAARTDGGGPGVHVVTPLRPVTGGAAVLVDRGWLPADDAATARPQDDPEPGERDVIGIAEPAPRGTRARYRRLEAPGMELWSSLRVDLDSLGARLPYALAPILVRQLPGAGVADRPRRLVPKPADESMHLGYAVQWFLFATILVVGSIVLAVGRHRRGPPSDLVV